LLSYHTQIIIPSTLFFNPFGEAKKKGAGALKILNFKDRGTGNGVVIISAKRSFLSAPSFNHTYQHIRVQTLFNFFILFVLPATRQLSLELWKLS
jgi:hypothetical protein